MSIIGICGQKNSGKSTVARFIGELVPGTAEVQLAEPLKRFCADVFDWKDDVLNGPSELREKPDKRYAKGYRAPSGEYVAGPEFEDRTGATTRTRFKTLNDDEQLEAVYLTPRFALQRLGTEWGRACYEDVWIDYALRRAGRMLETPQYEPWVHSSVRGADAKLVVIPDVRFVNEARKIREAGGQVWRVKRGERRLSVAMPITRDTEISTMIVDAHASEREQFSVEMDKYVSWDIVNDRDLESLREAIRTRLLAQV